MDKRTRFPDKSHIGRQGAIVDNYRTRLLLPGTLNRMLLYFVF